MPLSQLFHSLAERLERRATAKAVFGDPITVGEKVIVPVARIAYGFGAGVGKGGRSHGDDSEEEVGGGGGGVMARPLGVFEITARRTRFIPLAGRGRFVGVLMLGMGLAFGIARVRSKGTAR